MTALEDAMEGSPGMAGLVSRLSSRLGQVRRRDFFVGAAVAGSALVTEPKAYALRPGSAYSRVCGPGATRTSGWTALCCTINKGVNACPPGSFAAGWWKASNSSWCGRGARYIVDCNASCKCGCGSGTHICSRKCWSCKCTHASGTCDERRVCCNAFRYGQCNTQIGCSGGVHCRVMTCVPPYRFANCTTTTLVDNRTSEHSAPCIPAWGPIAATHKALGAERSFLKASTGPVRRVGDGRGTFVNYQGGSIHHSAKTGARAMSGPMTSAYRAGGGPRTLGYPNGRLTKGLLNKGMWQPLERGVLVDSVGSPTVAVGAWQLRVWRDNGRESGKLGYPLAPVRTRRGKGWVQVFQKGAMAAKTGRPTYLVLGQVNVGWKAAGLETGVLGFPVATVRRTARGTSQMFERGEIWTLGSSVGRRVYGGVLTEWKRQGGASGRYGYPVTDTRPKGARLTCRFENGEVTA